MHVSAKDWDQHVAEAEEFSHRTGVKGLHNRILALAEPKPSDEVVDIGCGAELLRLALTEDVEHIWALDISPAMCEYVRAKSASAGHTTSNAAVASPSALPLVDESADAATGEAARLRAT